MKVAASYSSMRRSCVARKIDAGMAEGLRWQPSLACCCCPPAFARAPSNRSMHTVYTMRTGYVLCLS